MADVRLHGLFREEEALADLAVDETVRDELKHLDLARGRILADLTRRGWREGDDCPSPARATASRSRLKTSTVVAIPVQDLSALSSVHVPGIGAGCVAL